MRNFGLRRRALVVPDVREEAHGDFPHLDADWIEDLDRDANHDLRGLILAVIGALTVASMLVAACSLVLARDDGRYANSPLKPWFDRLKSGRGLCCSFADGRAVEDPDWGTESVAIAGGENEIRYWVIVDGQRLNVPPDALVTEPNRAGHAVVWPYQDASGATQIRCFIPGAGT